MLCVPAKSCAVGLHRAQIHTSTRQNGRCAPSEPRLHTRSMQVHKETRSTHGGGDITGSGCWLSAAVLIKRRIGPGCPVYGLMIDQSILLAQALHPFCVRQGVRECVSTVVGLWLCTGLSLQICS